MGSGIEVVGLYVSWAGDAEMSLRKPKTTAVLCTRDRHDLLKSAVLSLAAQKTDEFFEIVIIDNSLDQEQANRCAQDYKNISNLHYHFELLPGLSNARNRAMEVANGSIIAFMDDDACANTDWLQEISAAFQFGSRVGCVGGTVLPIWQAARPAWLHDHLLGYLTIIDRGGETRELNSYESFAGCNIAFDRSALIAVGGFSKALGRTGNQQVLLSNEELEVCSKLSAAGKQLVYAPKAIVNHLVPAPRLTKAWFRQRVAWQAVSDVILDQKKTLHRAKILQLSDISGSQTEADSFLREMNTLWSATVFVLSGHDIEPSHYWNSVSRSLLSRVLRLLPKPLR